MMPVSKIDGGYGGAVMNIWSMCWVAPPADTPSRMPNPSS
ncbi:Uncharacterised protein [Mycobacterium tuberculosis]|uniref:Uncharacterized protein n=1 Tax=Mycobacterium tuberculosis TaxID=1773 RepID=A0A655FPJ8_MYCTX|nr:Uncharacterised protein [Mycobacterium tuberculosis]CKT27157.1 Uncharacterised protein [Mycobacterium tuberculosis]CNV61338.1 Uncharacterised protein [Mycobacterium tuberculosis]CNV94067.1 Uncharacterised protein [Mycobacterium tuberculosis]COW27678.1 Uncharacterised protein [Mycobacterium tuberculosis]